VVKNCEMLLQFSKVAWIWKFTSTLIVLSMDIRRFYVDIHGYVHVHRRISCIHVSTAEYLRSTLDNIVTLIVWLIEWACCAASCITVLIQQNVDGSESEFFNRLWAEFNIRFCDTRGNYWLGNDLLHQLTQTEIWSAT